jgi:hypothetical protein
LLLIGLAERRARAFDEAQALLGEADVLMTASASLRSRAVELRTAAAEARRVRSVEAAVANPSVSWFTVRGFVEDRPATVRWRPGALDGDRDVLRRAEVIVAMGDEFALERGQGPAPASLAGPPVVVLLTVVRAFSRVTAVDLHGEWGLSRQGDADDG